jgi:endonuclease/exonuclease/phosphatase family metal-dependent hydrolase
MITILSYNIEYGRKLDEIISWINSLENLPQIICFQEFPEKELEDLKSRKFFKEQNLFFAKGLSSKGEFFGELTIVDSSVIKLSETKYLDFGPDHVESVFKRKIIKRSAIITEFKYKGKEFSLANVHLTPVALHGKRRKQLSKVIQDSVIERSIIVGDFNYSSLFNKNGLITFMDKHGYILAGENLITNKYKYKIPQQLDYVFYKNLKHIKTQVFDLSFSDHFPVITEFDVE